MSLLSPPGPSKLATLALVWLVASPVGADVLFEVGGSLETVGDTFEVRVEIRNHGDTNVASLEVEGELLGTYDMARIEGGVGPRASAACTLRFPALVPRPGLYALPLDLRFTDQGFSVSQRGYLLMALGSQPAPAVRVVASPARLSTYGRVKLFLESADGAAHRVRLRVFAPRGLNPQPPSQELAVPAAGPVTAEVGLLRGVTLKGREQGVLVVAAALDGDEERTTVASTSVEVVPDRPWLPRLRWFLLWLALSLLVGSVGYEVLERWLRPADGGNV